MKIKGKTKNYKQKKKQTKIIQSGSKENKKNKKTRKQENKKSRNPENKFGLNFFLSKIRENKFALK